MPSTYHWLPLALDDVNSTLPPEQNEVGPPGVIVGVAGVGFTTTFVVPAAEVQPATVIVTEYVPASAVVALERVGFCRDDAKPFGPVQAYEAPLTVGVESAIVAPAQYGPPLEAVGVAGVAFTTTVVVPAAEVQPDTVIVTE